MGQYLSENIFSITSTLLALGTVVITFVIGWQKIHDKIYTIEEKLSEHEKVHEALDLKIDSVNDIKVKLAEIKNDIDWIKKNIK